MASKILPRQRKSTSVLDQDWDSFEKNQAASISKAINATEVPAKEKHIRNIIIGTFQEKCRRTFWSNVNQIQLQSHPLIAWKFCHTLHKVLRDGHADFLRDSLQYIPNIVELGKLWGHLKDGYGKLIRMYCVMLAGKLEFHRRNPLIPGNLSVTDEEIRRMAENDINNYFQLAVEMLDYMDDILALQSAVFSSLDSSRASSMTNSGQCRLSPMIPCIQDSSLLYDYTVKLMFKLHGALPPDTLSGHRERFNAQFQSLRQFYINSSNLQYFKNLVQVPLLPDNPPNFLVASDLSRHVTPVVVVPEPQESVLVDFDTTASESSFDVGRSPQRNGSESPDLLAERDRYIEQLLYQIEQLTEELQRVRTDSRRYVAEYLERIQELESILSDRDRELMREREAKVDMIRQLEDGTKMAEAETIQRIQTAEGKARSLDEKFAKLKDVYQKLRDEHIQLLRQKAEVEKQTVMQKTQLALKDRLELQMKERDESFKNVNQELIEAKTRLEEKAGELEKLMEDMRKMEESVKVLEGALHETCTNRDLLQTNLDAISLEKGDLSKQFIDLNKSKASLEKRIDILESELKLRETECTELLQSRSSLSGERSSLEAELSSAKQQVAGLIEKLKDVESSLEGKSIEAALLSREKESCVAEISELKKRIEEGEARRGELEADLVDSTNCLQNTDMLRTDLESEVVKLTVNSKSLLQEKIKLANELNVVRSEFDEVRNMMRSLQTSLYEKLEERKQLIEARDRTESELSRVRGDLAKEALHRSEAERQLSSLNVNLQEMCAAKVELEREQERLMTSFEGERKRNEIAVEQMENSKLEFRTKVEEERKDNADGLLKLYESCIAEAERDLSRLLFVLDQPPLVVVALSSDGVTLSADQTLAALNAISRSLEALRTSMNPPSITESMVAVMQFVSAIDIYLTEGKTLATSFPEMDKGEKLLTSLRAAGTPLTAYLASLRNAHNIAFAAQFSANEQRAIEALRASDERVKELYSILRGTGDGKNAEKLLEDELSAMERAIDEAAKRISDMQKKSRGADSGVKLEVNGKVLESCTSLMLSVRELIRKSRDLQEEIVAKGKGSASSTDFYKRNNRWTDGLISASKTVGLGATLLVDAADKVVGGNTKFEQLVVSAQEIAASTAQLVFAGRVKSDPHSNKLLQLSRASKDVSEATGGVVATAKLCSQLVEESAQMDFTRLTLHQAKKMEMESQIRVKELENSLEQERFRLSALRKQHYQMAGESAGWDVQVSRT